MIGRVTPPGTSGENRSTFSRRGKTTPEAPLASSSVSVASTVKLMAGPVNDPPDSGQ